MHAANLVVDSEHLVVVFVELEHALGIGPFAVFGNVWAAQPSVWCGAVACEPDAAEHADVALEVHQVVVQLLAQRHLRAASTSAAAVVLTSASCLSKLQAGLCGVCVTFVGAPLLLRVELVRRIRVDGLDLVLERFLLRVRAKRGMQARTMSLCAVASWAVVVWWAAFSDCSSARTVASSCPVDCRRDSTDF